MPAVVGTPLVLTPAVNALSVSGTLTVPSGLTNPKIFVIVQSPQFAPATAAKFNGIFGKSIPFVSGNYWTAAFYIDKPAAGAHTLEVDWTTITRQAVVIAFVVENAGVPKLTGTNSGFGAGGSQALTTTKDNSLVIEFMMSEIDTHTQGSGQTQIASALSISTSFRMSASYKSVTPPGLVTMSCSTSGTIDYQIGAFAIPPHTPGTLAGMFLVF